MKDASVDLAVFSGRAHVVACGYRRRIKTRSFHHPTRKSVGYFGAVRLRDGALVYRREAGKFNGESFWEFLKQLRQASVAEGRRVIAISDNARYSPVPYQRYQTTHGKAQVIIGLTGDQRFFLSPTPKLGRPRYAKTPSARHC